MIIYAVADIHGRKENLKKIHAAAKRHNPDMVVIPGDLFGFFNKKAVLKAIKELKRPVFAIRGNGDPKRWCRSDHHNLTFLGTTAVPVEGLNLVGLNGTLSLPFASRIGLFESGIIRSATPFINQHTVLVAHPPPRGGLDRVAGRFSSGSFGLRKLIFEKQPMLVLCGHVHEQAGYRHIESSLVVNCALNKTCSGAIIEYDTNMPLNIKMLKG